MRSPRTVFAVLAAALVGLTPAALVGDTPPAGKPLAFRGARILPAVGEPIDDGVLVVENGKIVAVGGKDTPVPDGAVVRDVAGKVIIPGLVDTHSHVGIYPRPAVPAHGDGNEGSNPVQSGLRALDAIFPDDPGIRSARAGGVTTANIMPGSANVIGGATLYVKLRGTTIDAMRIADAPVLGGLKMANGENPKGYGRRGQAPFTRMKVAALQREQFVRATDYQKKWAAYRKAQEAKDPKATPPETDLAMEQLVEVLERKRTVHFHTHRADDLMTTVRLSEEFGFELVIQHGTEGYRVADELAKRKIPVSLTLIDSPGGKLETAGLVEENAAILEKAGVPIAINTDDFITESRFFLRTGAIAVRGGLSEPAALKALTINPAKMMHLDGRLGSLEKGKDADFVVLSGPPFSVYTQVLETYIDGKKVFDRSDKKDWAYQAGGYALADLDRLPKPPDLVKPQPPAVSPPPPPAGKAPAADKVAVFAGRLHTVGGGSINNGVVVIEGGKITAVGKAGEVRIPDDARRLFAAQVTPGLIDSQEVIGVTGKLNVPADQDQDEASDPNQADLRVLDGFHPGEPLLQFVREQGVTVVHATPGRVNVLAGQTGVFRTAGNTAAQMTLKFPAAFLVNLGETPKAAYQGKAPTTRMATANIVRTAFSKAKEYARKKAAAGDDVAKLPTVDLKAEGLEPALAGKIPVYFSAHRADDILTGLRLADEFHVKPVVSLATEGYLVAEPIAAAKVPVVVHPTMQRIGSSMETFNSFLGNAAALADRQVPVTICTSFEGYVPKTRVLRFEAGVAAVNGLGFDRALRAVTLDAAKLLGIDDRFGSIEVGKAADLVLYDGDPFENATHVTHTVIDGRVVYDRAEVQKVPFARRALPLIDGGVGCCLGEW
jgi:imidazolonepropionase-like amidohydrolase